MNKKLTKIIYLILVIALGLSLVGCGNTDKSMADKSTVKAEKKVLKLGALAYSEPIIQWIKEGLTPLGYKVEVVMFDANQLPATALKDGSIDGIIANHKPWIETFNKQNNSNLKMVEPYNFYSFFAIYSSKYKTLDQIPKNAKLAVPGDPSNLNRSLVLLNKAGLITLNEKKGVFYTKLDIKDNPKNISLVETEITQTARSINDVDVIISPAFYVAEVGKVDPKVFLFEDPQNKDFPLGLIVRNEDVNAKWVKEAMKIMKSDKYKTKFNNHFKGKYKLYE